MWVVGHSGSSDAALDGVGVWDSGGGFGPQVEGSLQDSQAFHTAESDLLLASFQGDGMLDVSL